MDMENIITMDKNKLKMALQENRLNTFTNWPFQEDCSCTPIKLAEAGFYHQPTDTEPDVLICYVCQKELDGWEPNDDPWKEHRSHAKECPFVKLGKVQDEMTVTEFFRLQKEMELALVEAVVRKDIDRASELNKELKNKLRSVLK